MPRNLSAEISADASDFISSVEAAADRSDNLGDQASQASEKVENLGDKSTTTATSVGALGAVVTSTSAAMSGLALATSASLVPALGALSATAVPLTATLGGLATAAGGVAAGFGAVVGTGLLAFGEQAAEQNEKRLEQINQKIAGLQELKETTDGLTASQQEQLASLKEQQKEVKETTTVTGALAAELEPAQEQFRESALALGQEFIPLIRDAIDALPAFIRQIEDAIGDLTPFAEALRDAGQAAFEVIPEIVDQIMDMGRDALPAVRDLGGAIADNAVPALQAMADTTDTVVNIFDGFGSSVGGALPKINQLGIAVLEEVVPALQTVGSAAGDVVKKFNSLTTAQQETAAKAALVAPAIGTVATRLGAINPVLGAVTAAVGALGFAWTENIGDIRTKTNQLVSDNTKYDSVADAVRGMADAVVSAFNDATAALGDFINENETAQSAINSLVDGFRSASSGLKSVANGQFESALGEFETASKSFIQSQETILVGSSGSGGLVGVFDKAITESQNFLQGAGQVRMQQATGSVIDVIVASFESLSTIILGSDGAGGVLGSFADQLTTYLGTTLPQLTGEGAEAVGRAIRNGILDLLKPLSGEDSQILDALADVATFLIRKVPQLFIAVGTSMTKSIIEGVRGLFRGLVGNSVLKNEIIRAANFLVRNMGRFMGSVGDAIVDTISRAIRGSAGAISSAVKTGIPSALGDFVGNVGSSLKDIGGAIVDKIATGIRQIEQLITSAVNIAIPLDLGDFVGDVASSLMDLGGDIVGKIVSGIEDIGGDITDALTSAVDGAVSTAQGILDGFTNTVGDTVDDVVNGGGGDDNGDSGDDNGVSGTPGRGDNPGFGGGDSDSGRDDGRTPENPFGGPPGVGLSTGGLIEETGAAIVHEGERVVPEAQVSDRGAAPVTGGVTIDNLTVHASGRAEGREAGRALKQELKRFGI